MTTNQDNIQKLVSETERIQAMGGAEAVAKQKARGKLDARSRLDLLFDPGTFTEVGLMVDHAERDPLLKDKKMPADGIITGWGTVGGALTYVIGYDFTVLGGSMGYHGEKKAERIRTMAKDNPGNIVWIIDSAGARVGEMGGSFFSTMGALFQEQIELSSSCNQVCIVVGPGVAGTAYIPGLADCVIMTRQNSFLALAGPPLVEAAISERVSEADLGGAEVHYYHSGLAHYLAEDETQAFAMGRKYLSYFHQSIPSEDQGAAQSIASAEPGGDQASLNSILPEGAQTPFDVHQVLEILCDQQSVQEFQADYGASLVCAFGRIDGFSVGILASNSMHFGGIITNEAAQKAARFIQICDKGYLPLVFLHDVPGFMVGSRVEKAGIIRDGAKFLFAMANSRVPKLSVVLRKSYGAGYFVMCGRGFKPDAICAWPSAEIALMGAEGVVNIIHRRTLAQAPDPVAKRQELLSKIKEEISAFRAARFLGVDAIVQPSDTRHWLARHLNLSRSKLERLKSQGPGRWVFPV